MTIKHLYPTQRPSLDLDFANSKRLDPRITFTRGSTATYVDAEGVIQSAANNEARFNHNPVTGESLGLLVEESRTNLLSYSEEFDNSYWQKTGGATVTANQEIAPDGTNTADLWIASAVGERLAKTLTVSDGIYSCSFFVKSKTNSVVSTYVLPRNPTLSAQTARVTWDLSDGTFTVVGGADYIVGSPSISSLSNGWFRCLFAYEKTGGSSNLEFRIADSVSATDEFYFWGAQLEVGSFPTSYIPTTSSTVTRAADVASLTNTGVYDTDSFTILNNPYGAAAGGSTLNIVGGGQTPVKRTTVYNQELSQSQINTLVKKDDEFWRWRILGSSFALPNFLTDGQVTVDWGDGTVETMTTSEHTFTDSGGYHDVGFRLDSGTYFRVQINDNATHKDKVIALGPAPESMKLHGQSGFKGCSNLKTVDATIDANGSNSLYEAWYNCSSLTSFPLIDTSSGTNFQRTWQDCSSLTSFPLIDTSSGTNFRETWNGCSSLTSFPSIDISSGTIFYRAWINCSSLTDFPANFFDSWTGTPISNCFGFTWYGCTSLTATSVENILNSIDTSGQSAPASNVDIRIDYDTGTGTPSVSTAVTNLKSRGWTITLNGVAQ